MKITTGMISSLIALAAIAALRHSIAFKPAPRASDTKSHPNRADHASSHENAHGTIDHNTATPDELTTLRGIGPAKAQAILEHRPYKSVDELLEVKGIKDGTLEEIKDQITVS